MSEAREAERPSGVEEDEVAGEQVVGAWLDFLGRILVPAGGTAGGAACGEAGG